MLIKSNRTKNTKLYHSNMKTLCNDTSRNEYYVGKKFKQDQHLFLCRTLQSRRRVVKALSKYLKLFEHTKINENFQLSLNYNVFVS